MTNSAVRSPSHHWHGERSLLASGEHLLAVLMATTAGGIAIAAWWWSSPVLLWTSLAPAVWLGAARPPWLVAMLVVTTPLFPVIRVTNDAIGAQSISTKGLFLSADDPLVAAIALVAGWRLLSGRGRPTGFIPGALVGLAILYPLVILINATRLEFNQVQVSFLYYAKWLEYAVLVFLIPLLIPRKDALEVVTSHRISLALGALASASYATFEIVESLRSSSYSAAASFPRASGFFGSLDPLKYGASEDPVNFGCYMIVAGAMLLAYMQRCNKRGWAGLGAGSALLGTLLSASRTPLIAGAAAYFKVQRMRTGQLVAAIAVAATVAVGAHVVMPELGSVTFLRFESAFMAESSIESSAVDRLRIATNSPVSELDDYWLVGHGHSAYRFIAEQHLAQFTRGVSRSLYNFWLTVWYDAGLFGVLLWGLLFVQLHHRLRLILLTASSPEVAALAQGLIGALWGLAVASLFGEIPYNWRVMGVFYSSVGICFASAGWSLCSQTRMRSRQG